MFHMLSSILGGSGMFLLGMVLLTEGVKSCAGPSLARSLARFTGTPAKACASGMLATMLVQSSSATTVMVIGFVSAGLLASPQALGVVFGASLGTTGTGWLVAVLGLKINIGAYALILIFSGAGFRLFARGKWRSLGMAIAGFGLIFTGVDILEKGMAILASDQSLAGLPAGGWIARSAALIAGLALTLVMQSSSAAVAATMVALQAGTLNFEQAAGIVIGAAMGTTVTATLAAVGASVPAKRTALAFVIFNLLTGLIALVSLPVFLRLLPSVFPEMGPVALAAFHTLFIALGVGLFLPAVRPFARVIQRMLPEREPLLTLHLDKLLHQAPGVAIEASSRALRDTAAETCRMIREVLLGSSTAEEVLEKSGQLEAAVREIEKFVAGISSVNGGAAIASQLHVIDHLARLQSKILPGESIAPALQNSSLRDAVALVVELLDKAVEGLAGSGPEDWAKRIGEQSSALAFLRKDGRTRVLEQTDKPGSTPEEILKQLDAMRWLDRTGYHVWRICHHIDKHQDSVISSRCDECHPDE